MEYLNDDIYDGDFDKGFKQVVPRQPNSLTCPFHIIHDDLGHDSECSETVTLFGSFAGVAVLLGYARHG